MRALEAIGFSVVSQRGSHVKLRRIGPSGERQTLTVPVHDEMDIGTLAAIVSQAARYVPEEELGKHFYAE